MPFILIALLGCPYAAGADDGPATPAPEARYRALVAEYEAAGARHKKDSPGVTPADPRWVEHYKVWPIWSFTPRFLAFAEQHPGDPSATDALLKVLEIARTSGRGTDAALAPACRRAFAVLARDYLEDERVVRETLGPGMTGTPGYEEYLRALIAKGRGRDTRARACMALVACDAARIRAAARPYFEHPEDYPDYRQSADFLHARLDRGYVRAIKTTDPEALSAESEALLERVVREFGDVPYSPGWARKKVEGRSLGDAARAKLDALRSVAVGMPAPEITGEDVDGRPMKLSDYRGKVVVLVFWGTWCGPCMRHVPHEKALVERLKGRPFVLLGVNSDADRDRLKKVMAEKGITWRSWWEGQKTFGPIANRWDVRSWPAIIVLDHKGVIRFKNLPHYAPHVLDEAVDALLKDMTP